jgi:hypothetical protein
MTGISVFPGLDYSVKDNVDYMERAFRKGIKYIFTSVHIPEANRERVKNEFEIILKEAEKRNMDVIVDISKDFFDEFDRGNYKIHALRLDFGFNDNEITELSRKYNIQLNASTVTKEWMERLVKSGLDIRNLSVCHNYYPRNNTGISLEFLTERNSFFKKAGLKTMAFVPGGIFRRGPLYEGLPTVESHRNRHILAGAQELFYAGTDIVLIGDSMAGEKELEALGRVEKGKWLLPVLFFNDVLEKYRDFLLEEHAERSDAAEDVIRLEKIYKDEAVEVFNTAFRPVGAVTMDNKHYGRYAGSIQISRKNLPPDYRVNVLGYLCDGGLLTDKIKPGEKISFYPV